VKRLLALLTLASASHAAPPESFWRALHQVETSGRHGAILGDNGKSLGPLQISRAYHADSRVAGSYEQVTDLAYALDNLRTTVVRLPLAPPLRAPDVALLDWNDPSTLPPADPAWDVVLAADCIWLDHLVPQHMLSTVVSDCFS
jgi:hypothetical protein